MITSVPNDKCYEFRGLEADFEAKKNDEEFLKSVGNGSIFFIIDRSIAYIFDEEAQTWYQI